jgi:hypothetical protein
MFVVSEEDAAAIRATFDQGKEFAAAVELRRLFPGITDTEQARACARTIAGWKPLGAAAALACAPAQAVAPVSGMGAPIRPPQTFGIGAPPVTLQLTAVPAAGRGGGFWRGSIGPATVARPPVCQTQSLGFPRRILTPAR